MVRAWIGKPQGLGKGAVAQWSGPGGVNPGVIGRGRVGCFSGQGPDWETPGAGEGRGSSVVRAWSGQWSGHEVGNPRVIGRVGVAQWSRQGVGNPEVIGKVGVAQWSRHGLGNPGVIGRGE